MEARVIRQKYLDFFKEKGHAVIPSAPLLPENDPTVLFTTAGMHPLVPYLLGEVHARGKRLTDFQKCIRTGDIDEVGDDSHLTFFEMLGNWSLGDYFKEDAIKWSYEFLTGEKWLGIDPKLLSVTVFGGNDPDFPEVPRDEQSAEIWKSIGMPKERIAYMEGGIKTSKDNWWGPAGQTGPCGPSTEMFYWVGEGKPHGNVSENPQDWLEIWNDVFMQYYKDSEGAYDPLKQKNVDTGMGLERTAAVLQGKKSVYETELFIPILEKIRAMSSESHIKDHSKEARTRAERIIADHMRAATMMAADGVKPSNNDQGYVMRRLIRIAIRYGHFLGIQQDLAPTIAKKVIHLMSDIFPELKHEEEILETLRTEEEKFRRTIDQGLREFEKIAEKLQGHEIDGATAFKLYDTYGFPIEMTTQIAVERGLSVDKHGFDEAYQAHKEKSRTLSAGVFKGGLQDNSWETTRLHTTTHLMHAALLKILGPHATQRGSNITAERTRFDFAHPDKLTDEQIAEVERYVNDAIASDHKVTMEIIPYEKAKERNAIGLFADTYGENVKVYDMGPWSLELCGGPHVEHLGQLGRFKITKQESIGAGLRRIKGVLID